jgi:RND family efflux transporter MFP subunit
MIILIASALLLVACDRNQPVTTATDATAVVTTPAVSGPARAVIGFHGVVAFRDETRLSFKVGGVLRHLTVDTGATVHAGQLLADIEPAEVDAQISEAQQLDDKAARDLDRGEKLRAEEVISLEQLQNLLTQREMAAAQLRAARFNRQRAAIVAPRDGTILRRLAEENEQVQAGQPVLVLGSVGRGLLVRAAISDRNLVQIRRGDRVSVILDAMPGTELGGTVTSLALAADPASGLFPLEVELDPVKLTVASGMVATLRIAAPAGGEQRVRVPASAIVAADGERASVFVVTGGKAHKRAVRIAFLEDTQVALSSGVNAGELVVSAGAPYLDDGEAVRASPAAAAGSSTASSVTAAP